MTVDLVDTDELKDFPHMRAFLALVERANRGDEAAMRELRPKLDLAPKLTDQLGNFAAIVRGALITSITGEQLAMAEAIGRKLDALRAELGQPSDGPLEGLLIDRVVLTWLTVHQAEALYAQRIGQLDIEWTDAYQRRIDRTQRCYLQAIRTLAQVRRLAVPATNVQVNVAARQVNQMAPGARAVACAS
jgi:hypothetical protein